MNKERIFLKRLIPSFLLVFIESTNTSQSSKAGNCPLKQKEFFLKKKELKTKRKENVRIVGIKKKKGFAWLFFSFVSLSCFVFFLVFSFLFFSFLFFSLFSFLFFPFFFFFLSILYLYLYLLFVYIEALLLFFFWLFFSLPLFFH